MSYRFSFFKKSPSLIGKISERSVAARLSANGFFTTGGKVLRNVYIPKDNGDISEIDIIYVTRRGLFVLEDKNYAGYIFGNDTGNYWTVSLYGGKTLFGRKKTKKYKFYNPILQNRTHILSLKRFLQYNVPIFSIITFNDRGSLKSITVNTPNVYVCNHCYLSNVVMGIWNSNCDVLTNEQVEFIYNRLASLTNVSKATKDYHVSRIKQKFNNSSVVCPLCGGKLIIRESKKGFNSGHSFYGCSNYPKCKYTRNL